MCVAIFKPAGSELPTKKELYNCYLRNSDGAGFAFYRDNQIHIKKGYMSFESFYQDFCNETFSKDENIFIHFRIATHGLVDGGNTHPFPVTDDFYKMRNTNIVYTGKCLIHNGVFHYDSKVIDSYSKIISDTMLFSKLLFDELNKTNNEDDKNNLSLEESVSQFITHRDQNNIELIKKINAQLGWSKIAIMNEDGSVNFFGNWLNHNGVYYSNNSYEGYNHIGFGGYYNTNTNQGYYNTSTYTDPRYSYRTQEYWESLWGNKKEKYYKKHYEYCAYCGSYQKGCINIDGDFICRKCLDVYGYKYCTICKTWLDKTLMHDDYTCNDCYREEENNFDENETNICLCCGQNYTKKSCIKDICSKCYNEYCT